MIRITTFKFTRDMKALLTLEKEAFGKGAFSIPDFAYLYQKGANTFLVAYQGDQFAAYISAYIEGESCYIASIAVAKAFRRQGIAGQLIEAVMALVQKSSKIRAIQLHVRQSNKSAIAFYLSMGFSAMFIEENYYPDEDAIVMQLLLKPFNPQAT